MFIKKSESTRRKKPVNFLYFALFFSLFWGLTLYRAFSISGITGTSRFYFLVYSFFQLAFEVGSLMIVGAAVKKRSAHKLYPLFIGATFVWFLCRWVNYFMTKMMNLTLWSALNAFVFNETMENFIELLHQSGIPLTVWAMLIPLFCLIPIAGWGLYYCSEKFAGRIFFQLKVRHLLVALPLFIISWDVSHYGLISRNDYQRYQHLLPWGTTLFRPKAPKISAHLDCRLTACEARRPVGDLLHKPNILLIVAESLRDDFITAKTAPHLWAFKKESLSFDLSLANANATHLSWFSIFNAQYPFRWSPETQENRGALPLRLFKDIGYQIRLYSAAELKYYGIDELVFGPNLSLIDHCRTFAHREPKQAWEADQEAVEAMISDFRQGEHQSGQLWILFLDSTHFNYSWPEPQENYFEPYAEHVSLLTACGFSSGMEPVKNRYRNALHYVDSLFGRVREALEKEGLYDETLIVFTGDHGEEFLEHGQLFHASQLSLEQLNAPIYMKLKERRGEILPLASHIDIFPTLWEEVTGIQEGGNVWDGFSLFDPNRSQFVLSSKNAWSFTPNEFQIHNGLMSLQGEFLSHPKSRKIDKIKIIDIQDIRGKSLHFGSPQEQKDAVNLLFTDSFNRLFNK